MTNIQVVSVDLFGTLVDVDSIVHSFWRTFLQDAYTVELADKYWNRASELTFEYFDEQVIQKRQYVSLRLISEKCFTRLFSEFGLNHDPKEAARILALHYHLCAPYNDTTTFLNSVGKEYPVCLSSDTDDDMLEKLVHLYPFEHIFTSDQLQAYKANSGKRFFSEVIAHYGVKPEEIIHIGDQNSDVIGANDAGIVSCWLNRNGREWGHEIKPDYEVNSLIEAAGILGVDIDTEEE